MGQYEQHNDERIEKFPWWWKKLNGIPFGHSHFILGKLQCANTHGVLYRTPIVRLLYTDSSQMKFHEYVKFYISKEQLYTFQQLSGSDFKFGLPKFYGRKMHDKPENADILKIIKALVYVPKAGPFWMAITPKHMVVRMPYPFTGYPNIEIWQVFRVTNEDQKPSKRTTVMAVFVLYLFDEHIEMLNSGQPMKRLLRRNMRIQPFLCLFHLADYPALEQSTYTRIPPYMPLTDPSESYHELPVLILPEGLDQDTVRNRMNQQLRDEQRYGFFVRETRRILSLDFKASLTENMMPFEQLAYKVIPGGE